MPEPATIVTILSRLLIGTALAVCLVIIPNSFASENLNRKIKRENFNTVFEPSGVVQLPDGRVVIVEDRRRRPVSIVELDSQQKFSKAPLRTGSLFSAFTEGFNRGSLEDLEAIDADDQGYVYAVTSHSRNAMGARVPAREKLVRFRIDKQRIVERQAVLGILDTVARISTKIEAATNVLSVKDKNGFNIEGMSFNREKDKLLFGLRSPVIDGKGVILVMENPQAAFENNEPPNFFKKPIYLDLDKGGIRSIAFDPELDGYLLISRREKKGRKFKLWFWSGHEADKPRRIRIKSKVKLSKAEGITPVRIKGKNKFLIVFDTGSRPLGKDGKYLLLDYDQIKIDPVAAFE